MDIRAPAPILSYAKPEPRRLRPLATFLLMLLPLVPVAYLSYGIGLGWILYILSGQHFSLAPFATSHAGTAMDQPTIGKWLIISTILVGLTLPPMAIIRYFADRRTRLGMLAFAIPASAVCLYIMLLLMIPTWWLIQYVHSMGFTPARVKGLAYCAGAYLILLTFLFMCWRKGRPASI